MPLQTNASAPPLSELPTLSANPARDPKSHHRAATLAGMGLTIAACASFAVLDTATKWVSMTMPLFMALWFRYFFQAIFSTVWVVPRRGWSIFRTQHLRFQVLRAVLFAGTSLFAFLSLRYLPLAEFTAIVALTPLLVTAIAALWLRQRVSVLRWSLVVLGLIGTLCIVRPGGALFGWQLLSPACLLLTGAGYQILTSKMAGKEDPATTQLYTSWLVTLLAIVFVPSAWIRIDDIGVWVGVLLMGLSSAIGHMLLLNAYARTTPTVVAPLLYSQIGFALLAGWLAYQHVPDRWAFFGIAAIALSGASSAWLSVRESR
jgi:drug/metabolite transporter (DMT)-like permease